MVSTSPSLGILSRIGKTWVLGNYTINRCCCCVLRSVHGECRDGRVTLDSTVGHRRTSGPRRTEGTLSFSTPQHYTYIY